MKLSEAIMLGSTVSDRPLCNSGWDTCLVGFGLCALSTNHTDSSIALHEAQTRWPWLNQPVGEHRCGRFLLTSLCGQVIKGTITLEEAVASIREVEPAEIPANVTCEATVVRHCEDSGELCGKKCVEGSYLCAKHEAEVANGR